MPRGTLDVWDVIVWGSFEWAEHSRYDYRALILSVGSYGCRLIMGKTQRMFPNVMSFM